MFYNKSKSVYDRVQKIPYTYPSRNQKFAPCYCLGCKEELKSHARNRIIPQRDNLPLSDLITPVKESFTNINYVKDLQELQEESQEESYLFLVKRMPVVSQKHWSE
ncbi:unnamed protein product [Rhizophagus irregularis]|uniref:Uncharacterized protein n=1 Tax=Rhizophagus irregularis TaxID=588596 RepID=A0A2N1M7Y1_9GLOM|nr:hypothetical protein RhiirC2_797548 [Rhizophagus irregularis]CAB4399610.1 unnamed protein product [Rhizophagus irregularis]